LVQIQLLPPKKLVTI